MSCNYDGTDIGLIVTTPQEPYLIHVHQVLHHMHITLPKHVYFSVRLPYVGFVIHIFKIIFVPKTALNGPTLCI